MKIAKIRHVFVKLHRMVFTKVFLCLQINGKQNTTFQFSARSNIKTIFFLMKDDMLIAHTELLLQVIEG